MTLSLRLTSPKLAKLIETESIVIPRWKKGHHYKRAREKLRVIAINEWEASYRINRVREFVSMNVIWILLRRLHDLEKDESVYPERRYKLRLSSVVNDLRSWIDAIFWQSSSCHKIDNFLGIDFTESMRTFEKKMAEGKWYPQVILGNESLFLRRAILYINNNMVDSIISRVNHPPESLKKSCPVNTLIPYGLAEFLGTSDCQTTVFRYGFPGLKDGEVFNPGAMRIFQEISSVDQVRRFLLD